MPRPVNNVVRGALIKPISTSMCVSMEQVKCFQLRYTDSIPHENKGIFPSQKY